MRQITLEEYSRLDTKPVTYDYHHHIVRFRLNTIYHSVDYLNGMEKHGVWISLFNSRGCMLRVFIEYGQGFAYIEE